MFYAHSRTDAPESDWEPLARHLANVEAGARRLGAKCGVSDIAALAGRLHDLGKYGPDFQARLRGSPKRADHSTAGAVWAKRNLPAAWGRMLAHAIAGHHAGLKDRLLDPEGRIESKAELLANLENVARADGVLLPKALAGPVGMLAPRAELGFHLAFQTRMVFSCLIDADRTAAGVFDHGEDVDTSHPSIVELDAALRAGMARPPAASEVNSLRDSVLQGALAKAPEPPGIFTLTVPTGGGKTLTSLAFALAHARHHGMDRVIVVTPFTSIIEQTAQVYRDALGPLGHAVLEHHSGFEMEAEGAWADERVGPARLRLAMEQWNAPIIVTTAVQFFESLFAARPSRCRKLHTLARSVIVVDEAQTMPLPLLRPCVTALKELARNYGASVVLCTATQPALMAGPGNAGFPGGFKTARELAPDVAGLFRALRRVTVRDIGEQDDAALAERLAASPQALCIVNQRGHARALFAEIADLPGARHLSTCMHSVHRRRVLAEIREDLRQSRPCRVVATSLVEAGVDVDFPLVLRASAGLDQIAQAAGRCNREGRLKAEASEVLVFRSAEWKVIRPLVAHAETGDAMRAKYLPDELFGPDAMRDYFETLYDRKGKAELDRKGVLEMCADHAADMNFPFESIAQAMRFIDDAMVPVIVPKQEERPGEVGALVGRLRYADSVGGIARKLGRYTVGVPRRVRAAMVAAGAAETIRPGDLGDQFVVLSNLDIYTAEIGLDWDDPAFLGIESLISC